MNDKYLLESLFTHPAPKIKDEVADVELLPFWGEWREKKALEFIVQEFPFPKSKRKILKKLAEQGVFMGFTGSIQKQMCGILMDHLMAIGRRVGVPQAILRRLTVARNNARYKIDGTCAFDKFQQDKAKLFTTMLIEVIAERTKDAQKPTYVHN